MYSNNKESYEELFIRFSRKVERWIVRLVVGILILLIVVQALMQFSAIRFWLSEVEQLEGKEYKSAIFHSKPT